MDSIAALVVANIRAQGRQYRWVALLLFLLSALGFVLYYAGVFDPTTDRRGARMLAYCAIGPIFALLIFLPTLRDPRRRPGLVVLAKEPARVVWHYISSPPRQPWASNPRWQWAAANSTLHIGLENGMFLQLPVRCGDEDAITRALDAALPTAAAGYSEARWVQFQQSPTSLRRA